jgi:hypothetical protein
MMSQVLTLNEIKHQYNGEWVLIAYNEIEDDTLQVIRGEVVEHGSDAEVLYKLLPKYNDRPIAIEFMGEAVENVAYIL